MKMILHAGLLFSSIAIFSSCNGSNQKSTAIVTEPKAAVNIGDTVAAIGKNISCVFQDKNNNFWFAGKGDGVYRYDGRTITHITEKHGLSSNVVSKIEEDANGNIWFSNGDSFCSFNGKRFTNYTDSVKNAPYDTFKYQPGGLFFSHLNGICFYDGKSFMNFTIYPATYTPDKNDMYRPYGAYCTLVDNSGNVWFGTEKGVCRYDGKSFSYITDKDLEGPAVRTIFQDKSGILWFGNNGGGLYRYDGKTLRNITEEKKLSNYNFLRNHEPAGKPGTLARVFAINEDTSGNLWMGTVDAGVWKYDGKKLTNYTVKDGLTGNAVPLIYRDNKGELWFVSDDGAIFRFNGQSFSKFALQ